MSPALWLVFLAGVAGSMHCVGMCGGFACALGADARGAAATWRRHLIYHAGRLTSYCFLGAMAGQLGLWLVDSQGPGAEASVHAAQRVLACMAGALVIGVGLQFLGVLRSGVQGLHGSVGAFGQTLARGLRSLVSAQGAAAPLALGVINGFLPCPLVYAFVAQAVSTCGAGGGLQVMVAFGLGTLPAMLAMGGLGLWLRRGAPPAGGVQIVGMPNRPRPGVAVPLQWRRHGVRIAGGLLLLLGAVTVARGLWPSGGMHALMGH
jgi:uncharacterized protein